MSPVPDKKKKDFLNKNKKAIIRIKNTQLKNNLELPEKLHSFVVKPDNEAPCKVPVYFSISLYPC